jgi:hypothetical protein
MPRHLTCFILYLHCALVASGDEKSVDLTKSVATEMCDGFLVYRDPQGASYFHKGSENYYTQYLSAMKEPSLLKKSEVSPDFQFRFTWLRSFHDPIAIRVWQDGNSHMIRAIRLTKQPDNSAGPFASDITRKLSSDEWVDLKKVINIDSYLLPIVEQQKLANLTKGLDGAQWIFEVCVDRKYGMIDLWSIKNESLKNYQGKGIELGKLPEPAKLVSLGQRLLKLAKIDIPEDEIY